MAQVLSKKQLQKQATIFIIVGFVAYVAGIIPVGLAEENIPVTLLFLLVAFAGLVAYIYGCTRFMVSKGYSPWVGLVGIFGLIGLIVLAVLPDKWAENSAPPPSPTNYPRYPES